MNGRCDFSLGIYGEIRHDEIATAGILSASKRNPGFSGLVRFR